MGKFEKYLINTLTRISEDKPINWELWFLRMEIYMRLIQAGMRPVVARRVMGVYLVVN